MALTQTHPDYDVWAPIWLKLLHVYGGTGGFANGLYLVPHPREYEDWTSDNPVKPTKKLLARRALARYEPVAATILDQKQNAIFKQTIVRTVGDPKKPTPHPLETWWDDVDGQGLNISDYMAQAFIPGGVFGSVIHVMDREPGPQPLTKADETDLILCTYTPLDMTDWLQDRRKRLTAVRLIEGVDRESLEDAIPDQTDYVERIITETGWKVIAQGQTTESGTHGFGCLPVVIQYTKRRAMSPVIGQSILNDPQLYVDLYNLTSEMRELLRAQTFGILNVPLGAGDNAVSVDVAKAMMGSSTGTDSVLFTPLAAQYLQPDTNNVTVYQAERDQLTRSIYRLLAVPWESDSKDAEAAGSMQLKREDMNQVLAGYADEAEKAEYKIAELWFRATYGESWQAELDKAEVVIRYPDNFDVTPFDVILQQAQSALTLEYGPLAMKEIKKRLLPQFLPDATPDVMEELEKELDELSKKTTQVDAVTHKATLRSIASGANPDAPFQPKGTQAA